MQLYVDYERGYVSYPIPVDTVEQQIQPFLDCHKAYVPKPLPDLLPEDPEHLSRVPREFTVQQVEDYHVTLLPSSFGRVALRQGVIRQSDGTRFSRFDRIAQSLADIREPILALSSLRWVRSDKAVTNPNDLTVEAQQRRFSSGQYYRRESVAAEVGDVGFRQAVGKVYQKFGLCPRDDEPYIYVTLMNRQDSDLRRRGIGIPLKSTLVKSGVRTALLGAGQR